MKLAYCVGCWCTDDEACVDEKTQLPCHWLRLDRQAGLGVCSCCGNQQKAWDEGKWDWFVTWASTTGQELDPSFVHGAPAAAPREAIA